MDSTAEDGKDIDDAASFTDSISSNDADAKKKKLPYLPPCRVCGSLASGFHYGESVIMLSSV